MKKLLFIMCILLVGGCTQEFKDIPVENPTKGTAVTIDSAQWTPALIQIDGDMLTVYESGEIREIRLINDIVVLWLGLALSALFLILLMEILKS